MHSSKAGIVDKADTPGDIAGSASYGAQSMDRFVANNANTLDAVNIADTADAESHPNMDHNSRGHMPEPERCGWLRRAKLAAL